MITEFSQLFYKLQREHESPYDAAKRCAFEMAVRRDEKIKSLETTIANLSKVEQTLIAKLTAANLKAEQLTQLANAAACVVADESVAWPSRGMPLLKAELEKTNKMLKGDS